jgi:hypothetical protein
LKDGREGCKEVAGRDVARRDGLVECGIDRVERAALLQRHAELFVRARDAREVVLAVRENAALHAGLHALVRVVAKHLLPV